MPSLIRKDREAIHVYVRTELHDRLKEACEAEGIDLSAAVGTLAEAPDLVLTPDFVKRARRYAARQRSRRPNRNGSDTGAE